VACIKALIQMRHFDTQYCNKKIKRYCNKNIFLSQWLQYPTKVSTEKNVTYLELRAYLGQKICGSKISFYRNLFLSQYLFKYLFIAISFITIFFYCNIFLSQYLFIPISFYPNIFLSQYLFIPISFIPISFYRNIVCQNVSCE